MSWIMVDIEADGPIPHDYSMIAIGAVVVESSLSKGFFGTLKPISSMWVEKSLRITGYSREETLEFDDPLYTMNRFNKWIKQESIGKHKFISDNNGFDFSWISWYFWHFLKENPFGHSSTNLGSIYKGCMCDIKKNFKHLRDTKHNHSPLCDAMGNAEALIKINNMFDLGFELR